jgi:hypothetical protein
MVESPQEASVQPDDGSTLQPFGFPLSEQNTLFPDSPGPEVTSNFLGGSAVFPLPLVAGDFTNLNHLTVSDPPFFDYLNSGPITA